MLVEQVLLFCADRGETQQTLLRRMEPAVRVHPIHAGLVPNLSGQGEVHEGEAPRLHLLRVTEDDELLSAEDDGSDGRQINLRRLVHDHHVKHARTAREQPSSILRVHDPDRQKLEEHARPFGLLLQPVEQGEVLVRGLVSLQDRRQLA